MDSDERPTGVGERLQQLIDTVGGASAAATLTGVHRNSVGPWTKGTKIPFEAAAALAHAAGWSLDWLAGGEGPRELGAAREAPDATVPLELRRQALADCAAVMYEALPDLVESGRADPELFGGAVAALYEEVMTELHAELARGRQYLSAAKIVGLTREIARDRLGPKRA